MARIRQVGPGRKTIGTIDGITYVTRKGVTYARSAPTMPASAYKSAGALKRQALFKLIQMHLKYHLGTIRKTFSPMGVGSPANRYYHKNNKSLRAALNSLADQLCAGADVSLIDVENAIATYATANPAAICIGCLSGYKDVFLTGAWPETITLTTHSGDSTVIIIVAENGTTTTITPDGRTTVSEAVEGNDSGSGSGSGSGTSAGSGTGSGTSSASTVASPVISGASPFETTTSVTISCATSGASIYYTTDGSTPTAESTPYTEAIALSDTTTVKAIAVNGSESSAVASRTFTKGTGGDALDTD